MGHKDVPMELVLVVPEYGSTQRLQPDCPHGNVLDFTGTTKAELLSFYEQIAPRFFLSKLGSQAWEAVVSPAKLNGEELVIKGEPVSGKGYAAISGRYHLLKGALLFAEGQVAHGGIVIGLLNDADQWTGAVGLGPGSFREVIKTPRSGEFRIAVANDLLAGDSTNDATVTQIGFLGVDPNSARLASPAPPSMPPEEGGPGGDSAPSIRPLDASAWESLYPPARLVGDALRLAGVPNSPASYAAVSKRFRLPKGTIVTASGTLRHGRILLGLLNSDEQWAVTTSLPELEPRKQQDKGRPGPFQFSVEVPADGIYSIVIANNLQTKRDSNDAEITEVGLIGADPSSARIEPPAAKRSPPRHWWTAIAVWLGL